MMNIKARFNEAMERHGSVLNRVAADLVDQINQDPELRKEATALLVALLFMPLGGHDDDTVFVEEPAFEDAESLARSILQTMPR